MKLFITLLFLACAAYAQNAQEFCSSLTGNGSGKDAKARTALMKLTHTAAKQQGSTREKHEAILIDCLTKSSNFEISTFILQQLDICGGKASIPVVGKLVNSPQIGANATRTLTNLAKYDINSARAILVNAYSKGSSDSKAYLLNAISVLKLSDSQVLSIYRKALADKKLSSFALQGLAVVGDPKDQTTFLKAFETSSKTERGKAFRLNLVFTEALAAKNKSAASEHLAKLKSSLKKTEIPFITGIASVDFNINGVSDQWLDALPQENPHTQTGIIRLLKAKPDSKTASKLKQLCEKNPDTPVYLEALAAVDAEKAGPFVMKGLSSKNTEYRQTAGKLATNYGSSFAPSMVSSLIAKGSATKEDISMAKSMVNAKNASKIADLWKDLNPGLSLAFIEITGRFKNPDISAKMISAAKSPDRKVSKAALKALKDVVTAQDFSELKNMLGSEKSSSSIRYLQIALGSSIAQANEDTVKNLFSSLYNQRDEKLLAAFARSNKKEVLPLLQKDLNGSAEVQKETIKILGTMKPELSADLLFKAIEKSSDERNRILAARALAEAAVNSTAPVKERKELLKKAAALNLPENEKKLLKEKLKNVK